MVREGEDLEVALGGGRFGFVEGGRAAVGERRFAE